ncbi:MAG: hypothetical protein KF729_26115 [Sandaracinaceae bacterium]|nr:hypothetical protein [Sandaracinaceae bacterium]
MRRARAIVALLLGCAGCFGTETGNPPVSPELDVSRLDLVEEGGTITVVGAAGAVRPAGGRVHLVNLDGAAGLATADVAADGSFRVTTEGDGASLVRVQAKQGALRSLPVDLQLVALPSPSLACVTVEPQRAADLGSVRVGEPLRVPVAVTNECGVEVTVEAARLRLGEPAFTLEGPPTPRPLADGARADFELVFTPSAPGEVEDVILFDVAGGADRVRLAVTVYGEGVL